MLCKVINKGERQLYLQIAFNQRMILRIVFVLPRKLNNMHLLFRIFTYIKQ